MSDEEFVPVNYNSESSSESIHEEPVRRVRVNHTWVYKDTFTNAEEAREWITNQGVWTVQTTTETDRGRRELFRCNKVAFRGPQTLKIYKIFLI